MALFSISKERMADAQNIIIQFMRDAGYEGSLEDGSGLNDIVVKPASMIYELFSQMADRTSAYQSLDQADAYKDIIGEDEYNMAVDAILSNWFVTRNDGKPAYGIVRLWFLQPLEFLYFSDNQGIGTISSVQVVVDGQQTFIASDYSVIFNSANNVNEYYIDVKVRTAVNTDIQILADATTTAIYDDIYFLRSTVPGDFTKGCVVESSEDFIARTKKAITTRELITNRAIHTVLREEFDEIYNIYVARHGSPEQLRDIVEFQNVLVHVGNKADIYIAAAVTKLKTPINIAADGTVDPTQLPASVAILNYMDLTTEDGTSLDYTLTIDEKTFGSVACKPTEFKVTTPLTEPVTANLTILTDPSLKEINDFVYSETQRVVCYDPMVKHMYVMRLTIEIMVDLHDSLINSDPDIKKSILAYIETINKNGTSWISSELIAKIHKDVENVRLITLPITCTGVVFDPKSGANIQVTIGNNFTVDDNLDGDFSKQITTNTTQYYSDASLITILRS